jgi:hypothetical protein
MVRNLHVATAQLPLPPAGADRVAVTTTAAAILDGATAFEPASMPASRYAERLAAALTASLTAAPETPLHDVLAEAISMTARSLELSGPDGPSSTVAVARLSGDRIDLLALGDSIIAYDTPAGPAILTDDRLDLLGLPERDSYRQRLTSGTGDDGTHQALLRQLQRHQRQHRNQPDGYWIAAAAPAAAHQARTLSIPTASTAWIVLATDGAADIIQYLGADDWPAIAHQDATGLAALLQRCHSWEEHADPHGRLLPRAKRHDHKTIAAVSIR